MSSGDVSPHLAAVRLMRPLIEQCAPHFERDRRMPGPVVDAMVGAGIFRMSVPESLGGLEVDLLSATEVIEELARIEGAAGWNAAIANGNGRIAAFLDPSVAKVVWQPGTRGAAAGSLNPVGRAVRTPAGDGFLVTGHWPYGSGVENSDWVTVSCQEYTEGQPVRGKSGRIRLRVGVVPIDQVKVLDTWHVAGLKGTGSHDFKIDGAFLPDEYAVRYPFMNPKHVGPLYRIPSAGTLGTGVAAVSLGLARASIDEMASIASVKIPTLGRSLLRERPDVQLTFAEAEATARSARSLLYETLGNLWEKASNREEIPSDLLTSLRLATWHAGVSAARAVDLMFRVGGSSVTFESQRLQRIFRDVHVVVSHATVSAEAQAASGQGLLGLESKTPLL